MIKRYSIFLAGWIAGTTIAGFTMSLWKNERVDWNQIVVVSIGGIIGASIVFGIKYTAKKHKE